MSYDYSNRTLYGARETRPAADPAVVRPEPVEESLPLDEVVE